jgi:hypothetical protein
MKRSWLFLPFVVAACGSSGGPTAPVANPVTVIVTNQLIDVITVDVNGTSVGTVQASSTGQTTVPNVTGSLTVGYDLNRPTTSGGTPIGEPISGVFATIQNPGGTYAFTVNNFLGTQEYFSPLITNNGANPILMVANWGLVAENRCNCTVSSGGTSVNIGYYRLFSNTEVRAYGTFSGYGVGTYTFWLASDFGSSVQTGSGVVTLTNSLNLNTPSLPSAIGAPGFAGTFTREPGHPALGQALPTTLK